MFKKSDWMVWLGALLMLAGGVFFLFYYKAHAPSPFDLVEEDASAEDFIPILVPAGGEGGEPAPTLDSEAHDPALTDSTPETGNEEEGRVPDRLVIPSIYLDAPVLAVHYKDIEFGGDVYYQWRVPNEFAAGWQDESALLGEPGNTVLNGHHNAYGMVFKDLVKMNPGDLIRVYSGEVEYRYVVEVKLLLPEKGEKLEVRMENARWLAQSEDERLTLVTCWPADNNTHRVIVVAFPEGASLP